MAKLLLDGPTELVIDLNGCARCQADGHKQITFKALTQPLKVAGTTLTHWAPCPTNGEPILMGIASSKANLPETPC